MTADNVWCGGVVLGNKINSWESLDFNALQSTLLWNNETPQKAFINDLAKTNSSSKLDFERMKSLEEKHVGIRNQSFVS